MEGLMCTLRDNDGSIMCSVDEFSTFLDSIDKHSNGNAERARYLSLWSGSPIGSRWSKKTKNCGLEEICQPRFQFAGFNQNYFLMNMILNTNQYDGFLLRFLVSTPEEVYVKLQDKIIAAETLDGLEMSKLFALVFQTFFKDGCILKLSEEAMVLFASYHDQEVLEFRKKDKFEDIKSMIMSKSIGNVLRVAGIQCALRIALEAFKKDKTIDTEDLQIQLIDMERAVVIVKYSVECLISLIDSTSTACQSKGVKRPREMPDQQECILFCAGKTRVISNCSHLFRSHMLRSCQFRVGVLYFAQVCTTFVVYSVTNSKSNARKNSWYCIKTWKNTKMDVCQWEIDQGLVISFTID